MIGVIAYGMGNIQSVCNAFEYLGHPVRPVAAPGEMGEVDRIVIPGVGAFPSAMGRLSELGFVDALGEQVRERRKPVLGICLGMQLLAEIGTEFRECMGLGWIGGRVELIPRPNAALRLPHVGWNTLEFSESCALFAGLKPQPSCYFVHSFYMVAARASDVAATVDYGGPITAAVASGNVFGVQFHPEKSQTAGLKILDNFARLDG